MVIRFSQFLTNLESLVAADRFGGKGTSANARNRPGPQRDPTSSGTVDVSMKVFALWTAMIAHGSHEHAPAERSVFAHKLFDAALKLPFFLLALAQPLIKVGDR